MMSSGGDEDERILCKYGVDCYQKNPQHHRRFKHPKRKAGQHAENVEKKRKSDEEMNPEGKDDSEIGGEERNSVQESNKPVCDDSSCVIDISKLSDDIKVKIETVFMVKMPQDFFSFFDFCESLDKNNPQGALSAIGIYLVGAFDLFTQDFVTIDQTAALRHYRYYFDPPEFQTVLKGDDEKLLHYGYFRDDPKNEPVFVASNEAQIDCTLNIVSENLFSAINFHIEKLVKVADPFKKMKIQKIKSALVEWSKKNGFSLNYSFTKKMRERRSNVVSKTFHGAGIVVPYNKKTELGYRELKEDDATLKNILKNLVEAETEEERKTHWGKLQPVITYASIANDECDFGTGLELGLDLFCFGHELLHKTVLQVLTTSYSLLGRIEFATILTAHLRNRKKGAQAIIKQKNLRKLIALSLVSVIEDNGVMVKKSGISPLVDGLTGLFIEIKAKLLEKTNQVEAQSVSGHYIKRLFYVLPPFQQMATYQASMKKFDPEAVEITFTNVKELLRAILYVFGGRPYFCLFSGLCFALTAV